MNIAPRRYAPLETVHGGPGTPTLLAMGCRRLGAVPGLEVVGLPCRRLGVDCGFEAVELSLQRFARSVGLGGCSPDDFTHTHWIDTISGNTSLRLLFAV